MTFHILQKNKVIDQDEVNDNFQHVYEGNWLPRTGQSLAAVDGTLDLGSSTYKYKEIHVENLEPSGELQPSMNLLYEETLSDTKTSFDITGLNGDVDVTYLLQIKAYHHTPPASNTLLKIAFNNVSTSTYGWYDLTMVDTVIAESYTSGYPGIRIGRAEDVSSLLQDTPSETFIFANTGADRYVLNTRADTAVVSTRYIRSLTLTGGLWSNTTSTITSIQIYFNSLLSFRTYSSIKLWTPR